MIILERKLPLERYKLIETVDTDEATFVVRKTFSDTRNIQPLCKGNPIALKANFLSLGNNKISIVTSGGHSLSTDDYIQKNIFFILKGKTKFNLNGLERTVLGGDNGVLIPRGTNHFIYDENFVGLRLVFEPEDIARHANLLGINFISQQSWSVIKEIDFYGIRSSLLNFISLLDSPDKLTDGGAAITKQQDEMLSLQIAYAISAAKLTIDKNETLIDRRMKLAEDFIRENFAFTILLQSIAEYSGCSIRTLHNSFRNKHGVSITEYILNYRMMHFRSLIEFDPENISVSESATASGFTHMGDFGMRYRRRFGETPRETLNRFRQR
jgi:AraC-like DNA-binding protein